MISLKVFAQKLGNSEIALASLKVSTSLRLLLLLTPHIELVQAIAAMFCYTIL